MEESFAAKKRKVITELTLNDKAKILQYKSDNPMTNDREIAEYFKIDKSTLSKIIKTKKA